MKVISCKKYNDIGYQRYQKAVEEYHKGKRQMCPIQGQFMFMTKQFEIKKYGYVEVYETGARWSRTKKEALNG